MKTIDVRRFLSVVAVVASAGSFGPGCGGSDSTAAEAAEPASFGEVAGGEAQPAEAGGGEASAGRMCGGIAGAACAPTEYCDFSAEQPCTMPDAAGVCRPRPEMCVQIFDPVCGCDGRTHGNECAANQAGTDVARKGECENAAP